MARAHDSPPSRSSSEGSGPRVRGLVTALCALVALFVLGGVTVPEVAEASPYVPRKARAKIDSVDVSEAPLIRIHSTFLNGKSLPVSPDKIRGADVYCNDKSLGVTDKIGTYGDLGDPMDLAIVIPMTKRLPEDVRTTMKEGLGEIVGQLRDVDRLAAFVDNGVGVKQASLDDDIAGDLIANTEPEGGGAFLYSSLEKAIDEMVTNGNEDSRRAIILVTDGFDIETLQPEQVKRRLMGLYQRAREAGVLIFVVMYKPIIPDLIPYFEGMARKTRATYRQTSTASGVLRNVKYTFGEIYGQLVVEFDYEEAEVGKSCRFGLAFEREFGSTVRARNFSKVEIEEIQTDWWGIGIIAAIIVGALILLLIIFLIVRKILKKRKAKKAEQEGEAEEDEAERPTHCGECGRSLMPDWTNCLFCGWPIEAGAGAAAAGGAAAGGGKKKKAAAGGKKKKAAAGGKKKKKAAAGGKKKKKAAAGGKKKKKDQGAEVCPDCGRAQMPDWDECLFCKAGIGAGKR